MDDNQRNQILLLLTLSSLEEHVEVVNYYYTHIYKEPCMTSKQAGEAWMREILNGHPIRCINAFCMSASLFRQLCEDLKNNYGLKSNDRISVN